MSSGGHFVSTNGSSVSLSLTDRWLTQTEMDKALMEAVFRPSIMMLYAFVCIDFANQYYSDYNLSYHDDTSAEGLSSLFMP